MKKATPSQKKVLNQLIFIESYETLLTETGLQRGELRDDLIQLINAGMIQVFDPANQKQVTAYDSDRLDLFCFRASSSGLAQR
ncbi:MAG: hypothetical protein LAT75_06985 [Candidatus Cyclonatronum sp.]|uniref:hypothetical protein n=1 Tax=Cyclonatronum sp. TaxID=3024185 RepID=UPI0025C44281|nr:hypothetical protein [Cyclonatronum sp.]MCC5932928.1 hypothetical protein [Balneolales bacterium]MCH8486593.1 hypothetical protein [Cyclonatronum sp.]